MRLRVHFGQLDTKEVTWDKSINDFPHIIKFLGRNYEWVTYDADNTGKVDMVLHFSELPTYDPNFNVYCPSWNDLFKDDWGVCDCGAKYSSFPWDHMRFCSRHKPWSDV